MTAAQLSLFDTITSTSITATVPSTSGIVGLLVVMPTACRACGTVRHDRLLAKVARRVDDADVLHLLKLMLKANGQRRQQRRAAPCAA